MVKINGIDVDALGNWMEIVVYDGAEHTITVHPKLTRCIIYRRRKPYQRGKTMIRNHLDIVADFPLSEYEVPRAALDDIIEQLMSGGFDK